MPKTLGSEVTRNKRRRANPVRTQRPPSSATELCSAVFTVGVPRVLCKSDFPLHLRSLGREAHGCFLPYWTVFHGEQ